MIRKATHEQTRIQNQQLVIKTIYDHGEISRAQIARITRLARPTVSDLVAELMDQGLVIEVGYAPSTGGRRPMLLSIDPNGRHMIGVDLSRQDFRGAVLDLRGVIKHREHRPLRRNGEALDLVYDLVDALVVAADRPLLGIGVGAPGLIDAVDGVIVQAVNLSWRDVPIRRLLEERYGVPVYIANDCQVAALGEYTFGNADRLRNLVVISGGWGIGSGIVVSGELLHGNPLGAGEIGHIVIDSNGLPCRCGNVGCLETVSGSRGIVHQVRELVRQRGTESAAYKASADRARSASADDITFETACEMFAAGDEDVRDIVRRAGRGLGATAAHIVGILGGCDIRLAGALRAFGPLLLDTMREEMTRRTLRALAERTKVEFATLGEDIVLWGASALLLNHELGVL